MSDAVSPAPADAVPVKLTAVDRTVLSWLTAHAVDGKVQASMSFIYEETGRTTRAISKSTRKLEEAGLLTITRGAYKSIPNVYDLAHLHSLGTIRTSPSLGSLPDCFRTRDLNTSGQLWMAAEKGVEFRPRDLLELAPVSSSSGVRGLLKKLEALAVPAVTSRPNPRHSVGRFYTFHDLTESDQAEILADLQARVSSRPTTRAQTEANHVERRAVLRERTGAAAYVDLLPAMMELVTFSEYGCWMWGGEICKSGYAVVDGVKAPGVRGHRITYHALIGPIAPGLELHHHYCRVRACINPRHVAPVTAEEHRELTAAGQSIRDWEKYGTVQVPAAPPLSPVTL